MRSNAKYFVLDDTLRCLYITLRKRGACLVGIKFIHNGKRWEADTPEEAIRLRNQLALEDARTRAAMPEVEDWYIRQESAWTPDAFWNFINAIQLNQKQIVMAIWNKNGITSSELAKALSLSAEISLAGILSGLSKQLKKLELKPSDLYTVETAWSGKTKTRTFHLQRAFCLAAEEAGWPEEKGVKNAAATKRKRK